MIHLIEFHQGGNEMRINIETDSNHNELEVLIRCQEMTADVEGIIAFLRMMNHQLVGIKGDETFIIEANDVLYAETVEKKLFLYTATDTYEASLRLYELEERLSRLGFMRISKSTVVNLKKVKSLRTEVNRKIRLTLVNDENIIVSRQYAEAFKERLGVK